MSEPKKSQVLEGEVLPFEKKATPGVPAAQELPSIFDRIRPLADDENLSIPRVMEALQAADGNIALVGRLLGRRRSSVKNFIDSKPELVAYLNDIDEELVDDAKMNIGAKVRSGDTQASYFILTTLGKGRGFHNKVAAEKDDTPQAAPVFLIKQYDD